LASRFECTTAFRFYEEVFGAKAVYREPGKIQAHTRGSHDIIAFEENAPIAGVMKGVTGFRLRKPKDIEAAARAVRRAGGKILEQGEFVPGPIGELPAPRHTRPVRFTVLSRRNDGKGQVAAVRPLLF